MRAGWAIGVPLTLLQWSIHQHTPGLVDLPSTVNNVLVSGAIYGADRTGVTPATQLAMVGATCFYASDPATFPVAPCVPLLHYGYASVIKPRVAPVKPFFVSFFWTVAIYYVPLLRAHAPAPDDALLPASLFLSVACLSHVADVVDRASDAAEGLATPAVQLEDGAAEYACALWATSVLLHGASPQPNAWYDAAVLAVVVAVTARPPSACVAATATGALLGAYVWRVELVRHLLQSSDTPHSMAMATFLNTEHAIRAQLRAPWRGIALDALFATFNAADDLGHHLLVFAERVMRS